LAKEKGRQWDGVSRPSDDNYRENFNRIFGKKKELIKLPTVRHEYVKSLMSNDKYDNIVEQIIKDKLTVKRKKKKDVKKYTDKD
jgi:hypothetical protein